LYNICGCDVMDKFIVKGKDELYNYLRN